MRTKIIISVATTGVLLSLASAGYAIAAREREVEPTPKILAANWRTDNELTSIDLHADGSFTASGISTCIGPIGLLDSTTRRIQRAAKVIDGDGTGSYGWYPGTNVGVLIMRFRTPTQPPLPWTVTGLIERRFHPVSLTLAIINQAETDPQTMMCTLHSH